MDLTQKVFLVVNQKLAGFEGRSQLATWLFGICQRVASDYRRSALIRCEVVTDASELDLRADEDESLVEKSESRRRAEVAEAILSRLPEPQRVVFVLFELEEMSGDDIAGLLEVPVGTVRSRLRLARETFRREVRRLAAVGSVPRKEAV
jgi:RNA polymerase sigma-70 factor (ECF subfamily)